MTICIMWMIIVIMVIMDGSQAIIWMGSLDAILVKDSGFLKISLPDTEIGCLSIRLL